MMTKETIGMLEKEVEDAISAILKRYHRQEKGVRIQQVQLRKETLTPPGMSYAISIAAQVTFPPNANSLD